MSGKFNWAAAKPRRTGPETIVGHDGMNQPVDVSYQLGASHAFGKRWGADALRADPNEAPTTKDMKQHVLRILAEYARSYRLKTPPRPIERVPVRLVEQIHKAGGVMEWIEADTYRRRRFWQIVEEQKHRRPTSKPSGPLKKSGRKSR